MKTNISNELITCLSDALFALESLSESDTAKDAGEFLDELFNAAGYELQLHQRGIQGTSVIAVPKEGK